MSEAQEKYAKWHARQFELGACNCRECKSRRSGGKEERAAPVVAPESPNFAVASRSDGLATAPPAPVRDDEIPPWMDYGVIRCIPWSEAKAKEKARERQEMQDKYAHAAAQAVHAKLSYEEARARLEREFGVEAVGKAIDGLTKLLGIRDDVDRLVLRTAKIAEDAEEANDILCSIRGKLDGED